MVIGYDTRRNADLVAEWTAEVCLGNGFEVDFANRDTPTPALVYYLTDYLPADEVAGLLICTASHNPPEWQGIKFNPRLGYPAPSNVTDFLAFHINELQLVDDTARSADLAEARQRGRLRGFDPLDDYVSWIKDNGNGNARIPIDFDRIRKFFCDKSIVIDEFHGSGRGYLTRLAGEAGVRYTVVHAQRDPDLPGLDYANPEEPFIEPLKAKVAETGAQIGMGMDTDADRFGIVDKGGVYFRPNQILPMLIRYLGIERGLTGRVIATQTGSPLIEHLAGMISGNEANEPAKDALTRLCQSSLLCTIEIGAREDRVLKHAFLVPVGIKYIEEIRRTNRNYESEKPLPDNWRDRILIGGEESSGLTTRGHVTDKDGPWANLLILDMLAYFGTREENPLTTMAEPFGMKRSSCPGCGPPTAVRRMTPRRIPAAPMWTLPWKQKRPSSGITWTFRKPASIHRWLAWTSPTLAVSPMKLQKCSSGTPAETNATNCGCALRAQNRSTASM